MKVLNFVEDPRIGGPQMTAMLLARHLKPMGCDVTVCTASTDAEPFERLLVGNGVPFLKLPLDRLANSTAGLLRYALTTPISLWRIWKVVRTEQPDIVHVNGAAQWRAAFVSRIAGTQCVWTLNDTRLPKPVRWLFLKIAHRFANGFIFVAERVKHVYPVAVDDRRPSAMIPAPVDTRKLNIDQNQPNNEIAALAGKKFVSVGNINPDKDIKTLVRVAELVGQQFKDEVLFLHVGGSFDSQRKYQSEIDQLLKDCPNSNIRFLGHRDDVPSILAAADFYICTSRNEASPISVWEAMVAGLPVVSTDVGDLKMLFRQGRFGTIVPIEMPAELSDAVCQMIQDQTWEDDTVRSEISEFAEMNFSAHIISERHLEFYQGLIDSN